MGNGDPIWVTEVKCFQILGKEETFIAGKLKYI